MFKRSLADSNRCTIRHLAEELCLSARLRRDKGPFIFIDHKKSHQTFDDLMFKRSLADSNRCTSFCRALPSHSAKGPYVYAADLLCLSASWRDKGPHFLPILSLPERQNDYFITQDLIVLKLSTLLLTTVF